jgi:hypothetical protein
MQRCNDLKKANQVMVINTKRTETEILPRSLQADIGLPVTIG